MDVGCYDAIVESIQSRAIKKVCESMFLQPSRIICTRFGDFKLVGLQPGQIKEVKLTKPLQEIFNRQQLMKYPRSTGGSVNTFKRKQSSKFVIDVEQAQGRNNRNQFLERSSTSSDSSRIATSYAFEGSEDSDTEEVEEVDEEEEEWEDEIEDWEEEKRKEVEVLEKKWEVER